MKMLTPEYVKEKIEEDIGKPLIGRAAWKRNACCADVILSVIGGGLVYYVYVNIGTHLLYYYPIYKGARAQKVINIDPEYTRLW